jgi:hypothetical protein
MFHPHGYYACVQNNPERMKFENKIVGLIKIKNEKYTFLQISTKIGKNNVLRKS